jgi:hypothetical protein
MTTAIGAKGHHPAECNNPPVDYRLRGSGPGYASGKDDYLSRLRRIEGQVRGLQRMVEEDR